MKPILIVRDTTRDTVKMKPFLKAQWCIELDCTESDFLCYPEDGCCCCGVDKHHVHCKNCGGIMQVG